VMESTGDRLAEIAIVQILEVQEIVCF
jgi:hypothetical protein